jgi:molybdopterin converting factor small subunit
MRITVQFTGLFKVLAGVDQDLVDVAEGTTVNQLARTLGCKYEKLPIESELTFFVVNDNVSNRDHILADGDQVRIFQMLAGG